MIDASVLIKIAKKAHIKAERLERDYVMGLILDALSKCEKTKDDVIFKGGTCVHKCFTFFERPKDAKTLDPYFTQGRFSSDIDLTISKRLMSTDKLIAAFSQVADYLEKEHGLILEDLSFPMHFNPKQEKTNSRAGLRYRGPLYLHGLEVLRQKAEAKGKKFEPLSPPNLKIDITADEKVVYEPSLEAIYHPYPSDNEKEKNLRTRCYSLQGMFAEKVRSLFERCSPRDLYDLHILYAHPDIQSKKLEIGEAMIGKFRFKNLPLNLDETLLTTPNSEGKSLKDYCKEEWQHSLSQQVGELGKFEDFWDNERFPKIMDFARDCMSMALAQERQRNRLLSQGKEM